MLFRLWWRHPTTRTLRPCMCLSAGELAAGKGVAEHSRTCGRNSWVGARVRQGVLPAALQAAALPPLPHLTASPHILPLRQVHWKATSIPFVRRFERYLDFNFFEHQVRVPFAPAPVCTFCLCVFAVRCGRGLPGLQLLHDGRDSFRFMMGRPHRFHSL